MNVGLNHFNRVSRGKSVEFLQDFLPVGVPNETSPLGSRELRVHIAQQGVALPRSFANGDATQNRAPITEAEALVSLCSFDSDISTVWGPSRSCTPSRRQGRDWLFPWSDRLQDGSGWRRSSASTPNRPTSSLAKIEKLQRASCRPK